MLEQSLVTFKAQRNLFLSLPVSIALHAGIIAAAVAAAVWNVELPKRPPNQMTTYTVGQMPVVPGPPPARGDGQKPAPQPKTPVTPPADLAAPVAIPDAVPDVPAVDPGSGTTAGDGEGGEPGGVPWGVPGGVGNGEGGGGLVAGGESAPILRPGGNVTVPLVLTRVDPRYPEAARAAHLEGIVTLECVIGADGTVRAPRVVRSAHPILDRAAAEAVTGWRFRPATLNGQPVDVYFFLTVRYTLGR